MKKLSKDERGELLRHIATERSQGFDLDSLIDTMIEIELYGKGAIGGTGLMGLSHIEILDLARDEYGLKGRDDDEVLAYIRHEILS